VQWAHCCEQPRGEKLWEWAEGPVATVCLPDHHAGTTVGLKSIGESLKSAYLHLSGVHCGFANNGDKRLRNIFRSSKRI
jgi:hypothetical protein